MALFVVFSGQLSIKPGIGAVLYGSLWPFLGSLAVQVGYAGFGAALRRWVENSSAIRIINAASGAVIAAFGASGAVSTLRA